MKGVIGMRVVNLIYIAGAICIALTAFSVAQESRTIPYLVRHGFFDESFTDEGGYPTFAGLEQNSDLIVRCRIVSGESHLTQDQTQVYTEYKVESLGIFKLTAGSDVHIPGPHKFLQIRRQGGVVMVNGREFRSEDRNFPGFLPNEEYVLFLSKDKNTGKLTVVAGGQGAFRIVNGNVNHVDRLGFKDEQIRNVDYHAFADRLSKAVAKSKSQQP